MTNHTVAPRRKLTVIAQDPGVTTRNGRVLMTEVEVPAEALAPGPRGHRVHVVDFDSSTNRFYRPLRTGLHDDLLAKIDDRDRIEANPHLHAQNVYAIVSSTLLAFEAALGRHVSWGFDYGTHQIKVAPHAFADANAFYSREDESLSFGYFPAASGRRTVFTCLSHDIVAHETTHALLNGLRRQYMRPSSADQAAFHEGFADLVALLAVLRSPHMIEHGLAGVARHGDGLVRLGEVQQVLDGSFLTGLAEEMGQEMEGLKRDALRRSIAMTASPDYYHKDPEYAEAHARGEILVAVVMQAFMAVWWSRLGRKAGLDNRLNHRLTSAEAARRVEMWRVVEEGATAARHLLNLLIRALDYMPPVDICFGDMLSAAITADAEAYPDDTKYSYRNILHGSFAAFGIKPTSTTRETRGSWQMPTAKFAYEHVHFEPMRWDREAVFRFIWENRRALKLVDQAFTMVESVRPVMRVGTDGFALREVVVEYFQLLTIQAGELKQIGLRAPDGLSPFQSVRLYGGGTLVFDEFGRLKYDIGNRLNSKRQNERLEELYQRGGLRWAARGEGAFAQLHRDRMLRQSTHAREQW